jgi:hypothetical protein
VPIDGTSAIVARSCSSNCSMIRSLDRTSEFILNFALGKGVAPHLSIGASCALRAACQSVLARFATVAGKRWRVSDTLDTRSEFFPGPLKSG